MIHVARKGEEKIEARSLSRRGFLSMLAGGAAAAAMPSKSYFFFGGIYRPPALVLVLPPNIEQLIATGAAIWSALVIGPGFALRK